MVGVGGGQCMYGMHASVCIRLSQIFFLCERQDLFESVHDGFACAHRLDLDLLIPSGRAFFSNDDEGDDDNDYGHDDAISTWGRSYERGRRSADRKACGRPKLITAAQARLPA